MRFVLIISQSGFDRDHETVAFYLSRAVPTLRELAEYLIGSLLITPVKVGMATGIPYPTAGLGSEEAVVRGGRSALLDIFRARKSCVARSRRFPITPSLTSTNHEVRRS